MTSPHWQGMETADFDRADCTGTPINLTLALAPRSLPHELLKPSTHLHRFSHAHLANCVSFSPAGSASTPFEVLRNLDYCVFPSPTEVRSPDVVPMLYPPGRCFIKSDEKQHLKGPRGKTL